MLRAIDKLEAEMVNKWTLNLYSLTQLNTGQQQQLILLPFLQM